MHRHHLVPKHLDGTDCEENLTPPISVQLHAEFHRWLWVDGGNVEDFVAWRALSGRITSEQARLAAAAEGQRRSAIYRDSCTKNGQHLKMSVTSETRAKGGRVASVKLKKWQEANRAQFRAQCAENGRRKTPKQMIPHEYLGVRYESKKALQAEHSMSICGFYGKLKRGEITRLDREIASMENSDAKS